MATPTAVRGVVAAAEGLIDVGRSEEARRLFRRALDLEPGDARAAVGLARLLIAAGDLHGAVSVAQTALSCNPDDLRLVALHGDIGLALYRAQLWEDAEPWLSRVTALEAWNSAVASAHLDWPIIAPLFGQGGQYLYFCDRRRGHLQFAVPNMPGRKLA